MMSIGAPLALLHALAPAHRGHPLLCKVGIPLTVMAAALMVVVVHQDGRQTYGYAPSLIQIVSVLAVVTVVAGLAFTRLGAPLRTTPTGRGVPAFAVVGGAMLLKLSTDLLPPTWPGAVSLVVFLALSGAILAWCARHRRWGAREIGLLGAGVVVAGALAAFASPIPEGVTLTAKLAHSGVLLALALVVLVWVLRRVAPEPFTTKPHARPGTLRPTGEGKPDLPAQRRPAPHRRHPEQTRRSVRPTTTSASQLAAEEQRCVPVGEFALGVQPISKHKDIRESREQRTSVGRMHSEQLSPVGSRMERCE